MGCHCNTMAMSPCMQASSHYSLFHFYQVFSMGSSQTLVLVMAVFLLGTCWVASGIRSSPLKVANNLKHGALTVLSLPGCCSPCGPNKPPQACPQYCVTCREVFVKQGRVGTVDTHVGPYPLPYMMIQVKEKVWCVDSNDLWLLKDSVTLAVGPGGCGPYNTGLKALAFVLHDERPSHATPVCMYVCNRD